MSAKPQAQPALTPPHAERSLDPEDWEELRQLGHEVFDDMLDYLRTVGERPAWRPIPAACKARFAEGLPKKATDLRGAYQEITETIAPFPTGNIHPRFWSWVGGTGTPAQLIADLVVSAMNSGSLGFDEASSTYIELQVLDWLKAMLGFPASTSGLLVSGGSMANLVGLAVARQQQAGYDIRKTGVDPTRPRLRFYASTQLHSSVTKAVELLGLGNDSLRLVPVKDDFTIDLGHLRDAIDEDREQGFKPAAIVANVGTVNSGAIDPISELADIAEAESLWLHADGAFGAFVRLSGRHAHLVEGLERCDSLGFDLHKWMAVQYDCGCVFVRSRQTHHDTFCVTPDYLRTFEEGLASGPLNFSEYGVQLSRSFKALRVWYSIKTQGAARFGDLVDQNVAQAAYLTRRIRTQPDLELLAPTPLNIVNFRFAPDHFDEALLDDLNAELLVRLQTEGIATPSSTQINDRFSIRVAIVNHRSTRADFDALIDGVLHIGRTLIAGAKPAS